MDMTPGVKQKFESYPPHAQAMFKKIRAAIYDVAQFEHLGKPEETLKWGEPSYLVKTGSPVRVDWKPKHPNQISVYFNCKTTLVETFKEIFGDVFKYEGNREIIFSTSEELPLKELKICMALAFQYHKVKHLPMLGVI